MPSSHSRQNRFIRAPIPSIRAARGFTIHHPRPFHPDRDRPARSVRLTTIYWMPDAYSITMQRHLLLVRRCVLPHDFYIMVVDVYQANIIIIHVYPYAVLPPSVVSSMRSQQ